MSDMTIEAKCPCQRCGQPIAFPVTMHNEETTCPHCGKQTTLNARQVRKAEMPDAQAADYSRLGAIGIACSILLLIIGFFIGIYLLTKGQSGRGCVCMVLSILAALGWLALMNS